MNELEFKKFYEETYKRTYYLILKFVGDKDEAYDLLQDSYVSLMQYFNCGKSNEELVKLVNTIAKRKAYDYLEKNKSLNFSDLQSDDNYIIEPINTHEEFVPDKKLDQEVLREYISNEIDKLPSDQRICIMMYFFEEMKINEIAEELSITEATVKSRLKYGKEKLKTSIDEFQKKNDIKLYNVSIVPLLLWFFSNASKEVPFIKFTGKASLIENTTVTSSQLSKASSAIKGILGTTKAKIIAGVVAVGLAATPVGVSMFNNTDGNEFDNETKNPMEIYKNPEELYLSAVDNMIKLETFKVTISPALYDGEAVELYMFADEEQYWIGFEELIYSRDRDTYFTKEDILLQNNFLDSEFLVSEDNPYAIKQFNDIEMYENEEDKIEVCFWHAPTANDYPRRSVSAIINKDLYIEKMVVTDVKIDSESDSIWIISGGEFKFTDFNSEFTYNAKDEYEKAIKKMSQKSFTVTEYMKDDWIDKEVSARIIFNGEEQFVGDKLVNQPTFADILEWDGNLDEAYTFEGYYEHGDEEVKWVDDSITIENGKKVIKGTFRRVFENEYNGEIKNVDHIISGIINENGTFDSLECHWYEWAENTNYEYDGGYIKLTFEIWD